MLKANSQGYRSYFETFQRKNNVPVDVLRRENALTDRSAYLNFLEIQLERVSAACLASQDLGNRIDDFAAKTAAGEQKVLSATKLIRLAQTYSEEQGREQARINEALQVRLASLERRVDNVSIAVEDAAAARPHLGAVGAGNTARNPSCPHSSGLCGINTAGLSEWMTSVDRQLEDLRNHVLSLAPRGGSDDLDPPTIAEDALSPPKEDERHATEAAERAVKATMEAMVREECAKMGERVRSLEAALEEAEKERKEKGGGSGNAKEPAVSGAERDRGRRLERCAELARDGLSRSRSRSPARSPNPSPLPPPLPPVVSAEVAATPVVTDTGSNTEASNDAVLNAVEDGTAVARRASEVAREALEAGQRAVERSVRAEKLAKTLAVRSFKLAKEQHGEITCALDRLNEKVLRTEDSIDRRQRPSGRAHNNDEEAPGSTERKPTPLGGVTARGRRGRTRRGTSTVPGEARAAKGSGGVGEGRGGAGPRPRVRTRVPPAKRGADGAHEAILPRALRTDRGSGPGQRRVIPRDAGGDTKSHRSVREIREILENSAFADTDNGRRIALGAARTALESILREASPGPQDRRIGDAVEGGGGCGRGPEASGGGDSRKVDELREAIRGAVNILSGISDDSHLQGEGGGQLRSPRCSRRETEPCPYLSRSRGRSTTPPRGDGRGKRPAEGYWIPPGNIPRKVGERGGGGATRARAARGLLGDEEEDEEEGREGVVPASR